MSVSAAGAQAGKWTIDGKALSEPAKFESQGGPVTINSQVGGFECAELLAGGWLWSGEGKANLVLNDCVALGAEDTCIIPEETWLSVPTVQLNATGSELTFSLQGSLTVESVEGQCLLISGYEESFAIGGAVVANVGAPAVQLPLGFTGAKDSLQISGGTAELQGEASMSLTGANAGKVLGASS